MNPRFEQQMKKGVLDMLVLSLLLEDTKYGYQIICELKERSNGMLALKEGTLYPILYRMEDDGFVIANWSEAKGKEPSRKYYGITNTGKSALKDMKKVWKTFENNVNIITGMDGQ